MNDILVRWITEPITLIWEFGMLVWLYGGLGLDSFFGRSLISGIP